jgi:hypothetical protein
MGGQVTITEREPRRPNSVRRQLIQYGPALVPPPPSPDGIMPVAQRIHDRVEVRADAEPVHSDVIGRVGDDCELGVGKCPSNAAREPGSADATGHDHDAHPISFS